MRVFPYRQLILALLFPQFASSSVPDFEKSRTTEAARRTRLLVFSKTRQPNCLWLHLRARVRGWLDETEQSAPEELEHFLASLLLSRSDVPLNVEVISHGGEKIVKAFLTCVE